MEDNANKNVNEEVSSSTVSNPKVLIVDDYPFIQSLIKNYFSHQDYTVNTASGGKEALKIIQDDPDYDLLILDIMMPDMSGYDVSRTLREKYSLFELPILLLTAKDQISDLLEGFDAGANDYLSKPFNRNELLARTKTLLRLKKLTQANSVLQSAIDLKNQFINMTIHDLKNPLSVVLGMTSLIQIEVPEEHEHYSFLSMIMESAELMSSLVNELLNAAQIESGKLMLKKEIINFIELAKQVSTKHSINAEKKKQTITYTADESIELKVSADKIRLQEILDNLVSNAVKYSPEGKRIWINVTKTNDDHHHTFALFEVKDEGPGLTDRDKGKIFGSFQKLSARPTGGESSTGLGLSIVKQLVELHDGKIWVESEHGKGSSFFVRLLCE